MTKGDMIRTIRKKSLQSEIRRLESKVREILNSDGDATENNPEIQAYRTIIAEKKYQLESL